MRLRCAGVIIAVRVLLNNDPLFNNPEGYTYQMIANASPVYGIETVNTGSLGAGSGS